MGGLGDHREGRPGFHLPQQGAALSGRPQHPEIGRAVRPVRRSQPQRGPQRGPPYPGVGVPLGFRQPVDLLQRPPPPDGPVDPPGQPLPAVGQGGEVLLVHGPQDGQHPPLPVNQAGGVVRRDPPGQHLPPQEGGGGIVRMVPPVMPRPRPPDGDGPDAAAQGVQSPEILHAQIVVGAGQQARQLRPQQLRRRPLAAQGEGRALLQKPPQRVRVAGAVQAVRHLPEPVRLPALAAEGQAGHHAGRRQKLHRPPGEGLRRGHRPGGGQLQHQIHAALQGRPGPGPLVQHGALPPLDPVPAHHRHHGAPAQPPPGFRDVEGVPPVEGVILRHNARSLHGPPSPPPDRPGCLFLVKPRKILAISGPS